MTYNRTTWQDGVTLITAEKLNNVESGIDTLDKKKIWEASQYRCKFELIAHRGFGGLYPESSIYAAQRAIKAGASPECDVSLTSDGYMVLMHDSTVDRTTSGTGTITALTWAYVSGLDAGTKFSTHYAGLHVPLFADYLKAKNYIKLQSGGGKMIVDNKFNIAWVQRGSTGVFTRNGNIIRIQSPDTSNPAFLDLSFPIERNTEIFILAEARVISGSGGLVGIDTASDYNFTDAALLDGFDFNSLDWQPINFNLQVPATNTNKFARLSIGVRTTDIATVEFRIIRFDTLSPTINNKPELIACCMLKKTSGNNHELHSSFPAFGVNSIAWNGNDTITITLEASSASGRRPLVLVSGTPDSPYIPQAGSVTAGANTTFTIKLTNGTSNAINMSTLNFYINVMVFL